MPPRKKEKKAGVIHTLDDAPDVHEVVRSGIVDLDLKIGGGWPRGCMSIIYGPESSGKSLIALLTTANAQRTCRFCCTPFSEKVNCSCGKNRRFEVLYVDSENYLESAKRWAKALGVAGDTQILTPDDAEEAFNTVICKLKEGEVDLVVIDSVAMLSPETEREGSFYDWTTGLHPRLVTRFARVWGRNLDHLRWKERERPPTLIVINQVRERVGVMYGNPETQPGGRGLRHASGVIVRANRKSIEMSKDEDPQPLFQTVRFVVEKSKVAPTRREGEFSVAVNNYKDEDGILRNVGYIENEKTLLRYALQFEVVKSGRGTYAFGGRTFKSQGDVVEALRSDSALFSEMFAEVNRAYSEYTPTAIPVGKRKDEEKQA